VQAAITDREDMEARTNKFIRTKFAWTDLTGADMTHGNFAYANFTEAKLAGAVCDCPFLVGGPPRPWGFPSQISFLYRVFYVCNGRRVALFGIFFARAVAVFTHAMMEGIKTSRFAPPPRRAPAGGQLQLGRAVSTEVGKGLLTILGGGGDDDDDEGGDTEEEDGEGDEVRGLA
jgi:hypothetical protein